MESGRRIPLITMILQVNIPLYHPIFFFEASIGILGCAATVGTFECESLPTGLILRLLSLLPDDGGLK